MLYSSLDEHGNVQIEIDGTPIGLEFAERTNIRSEFKSFIDGSAERKSENVSREFHIAEVIEMDQDTIKAEFTTKLQNAVKVFTRDARFRLPWKKINRDKFFEFDGSRWMMSPYRADYAERNNWTSTDIKLFLLSDVSFYDANLEPILLGDYIFNPQ